MRVKFLMNIMLVMGLLFLSACNSNLETMDEEETEEVREELKLTFDSFGYELDPLALKVRFTTNLPEGLITDSIKLINADDEVVGEIHDVVANGSQNIEFEIDEDEMDRLIIGDYSLELVFSVNYDEEINKDFLFNKRVGGYANDFDESDYVQVTQNEFFDDYYVRLISQKSLSIPDQLIAELGIEEKKEVDLEVTETSESDSGTVETVSDYDLESEYIDNMKEHASLMGSQFNDLERLTSSPQWGNFDWMVDLSVVITEIQRLSDLPDDFEVPAKYQELHQDYLTAMGLYYVSMEVFTSGLDHQDANEIEEAVYGMELALNIIKEVHEKLDQ